MNFKLFLPLILLLFCNNIYSQELLPFPADSAESPATDLPLQPDEVSASENDFNNQSVFVISSFIYNIRGMTRPSALVRAGDLETGIEITGLQALERYIQEKTQLLFNQRVLDSVSLEYYIGDAGEDGRFPVNVTVNTRDTWNIVAIPRPQYSTNTGFELILKARDYNFLGTMSPLRFDIGYIYDENDNNIFILELDSNIPFSLFGFNWNFNFYNSYEYRPDIPGIEEQHFFTNTTGLSIDIPIKTTTLTIGFNESFIFNQENPGIYKDDYGEYQFGLYMSSNPYISWSIPTGIEMGYWGDLTYTPRLSAVFNHELPDWELNDFRKGPFLNFSHRLGFNRIDWIGNFRRGFNVSVHNSFQYDFYEYNDEPWSGYLAFNAIGHFTFTDFFGISSALKYRQWLYYEDGYPEAGDVIRGIKNNKVRADYIVSLNLDLNFRILRFSPSNWLKNSRMRLFNFDLHFAPVLDIALYYDPLTHISFNHENNIITGGVEFIAFPEFFRSLFLRASFCFDLRDRRNYELFIGTEFHF